MIKPPEAIPAYLARAPGRGGRARRPASLWYVPTPLLTALADRVLVADGAMGTMLQAADLSVEGDFQGLEGCNEILNVTRPDVVRSVHDAYFAVASARSVSALSCPAAAG